MYEIDYSGLPCDCCKGTLKRYIEDGVDTGHGLYAILTGDLFLANSRLDNHHWSNLRDPVTWLYNEPPTIVYGSKERVDEWLSHSGARGYKA